MNNRAKVIVALDLDFPDDAMRIARIVSPVFPFFKIGPKLFTLGGPSLVRELLSHGRMFLDLKFHDIPTVIAEAVYQAGKLGVSLITMHASGGSEMMMRCRDRVQSLPDRPALLGVTVLTSMASLSELGIDRAVPDQVKLLASLAQKSGLDGIVCSPAELPQLRPEFPRPFLMVTPGIRAVGDEMGDQKRTASAADAIRAGADYVVIGRPIIAASDPLEAAQRIARTLESW
jgi:orotidine-5'-phosphate decarboxylase